MKSQWYVFISLVLSAFMVFSSVRADGLNSPPIPELMGNVLADNPSEGPSPGNWYLGADPKTGDKTKPPIVFIHGFHGFPKDWWGGTRYHGENDTYKLAHEKGYRTAFVQLYDRQKGAGDQWENGKILSKLLEKIYKHYGQKVILVAHSKGGVDAQAALVHYNAYQYVNKLITLGSPHQGCYLADLAYSWYMGWLAELLSMKDNGTFGLQTANMAQFRKETDGLPGIWKAPMYTVSGTGWGPFPSALYLGGYYLSQFGDNDGMITEKSTHLPYAKHIATLTDADHDSIRKGSVIFPVIEPYLGSDKGINVAPSSTRWQSSVDRAMLQTEQYVYGGELEANKKCEKEIAVDSSANDVVFNVMTRSPGVEVMLVSPKGKTYTKMSTAYFSSKGSGIFDQATVQSYRIKKPEVGLWKMCLQSKEADAYFLSTLFKGSSTYSVELPYQSLKKEVPLEVRLNDAHNFDSKTLSIHMKVLTPNHSGLSTHSFEGELKPSNIRGYYSGNIAGVTQSGVYNVTIEIKGKTKQGAPYQRSIIRSVLVGDAVSR